MNKLAGIFAIIGGIPFVALSNLNGSWNVVTLGVGVIFAAGVYAVTAEISKLWQKRGEERRLQQKTRQDQLDTWRLDMEQRLEQQRQQMEAGFFSLIQTLESTGAQFDKQTDKGLSILSQGFEVLGIRIDKQTDARVSAITQGLDILGAKMDRQSDTELSSISQGFEVLGNRMDKQTEAGFSAITQGLDILGAKMDRQTETFRVLEEVSHNLSSLCDISESLEKSHETWITASAQDRANLEKQTEALMDTMVQTMENKQAVRERLVHLQERMLNKLVK